MGVVLESGHPMSQFQRQVTLCGGSDMIALVIIEDDWSRDDLDFEACSGFFGTTGL